MKLTTNSFPKSIREKAQTLAGSLQGDSWAVSLEDTFHFVDRAAAHKPGSGTSRLSQIAMRVKVEGDSTLAKMGTSKILAGLKRHSVGSAVGPAAKMVLGPVSTVLTAAYRATPEEVTGLGGRWVERVHSLNLPAVEKQELLTDYFDALSEEFDSPWLETTMDWLDNIDEEESETRIALMKSALKVGARPQEQGGHGVLEVARDVAKHKPQERFKALSALLALMAEELDRTELGDYATQNFSWERLAAVEKELSVHDPG